MNKRFVRRWIKALRSGDYPQTQNILRDENGFCCLGVACHISKKTKLSDTEYGDVYVGPEGNESDGLLPVGFKDWIGLSGSQEEDLVYLNDSGRSFDEIADQLEEWLEEE